MHDIVFMDGHTHPLDDLSRWFSLGRMIRHEKPKRVIDLGDRVTFDSITEHTRKGSLTDRKSPALAADLKALCDASQALMDGMGGFRPQELHFFMGNHEYRYDRFVENTPALEGLIDLSKLPALKRWEVHPYRSYAQIGPMLYCHAVMNGKNEPMTGEGAIKKVAREAEGPVMYGHVHKFEVATVSSLAGGKPRMAVSGSCFMPTGHIERYAKGSAAAWTYGVHRVFDTSGLPDVEHVSIERMTQLYS